MSRWTKQQIADKVEVEGLDYAILYYFGRDLDTTSKALKLAWKDAWDALRRVETLLGPGGDR